LYSVKRLQCNITVNGETLEQVTKYKYLGSWLTEDGRCDLEIKTRIGMAKDAFWKHKDLLKGNIRLKTKKDPLLSRVLST